MPMGLSFDFMACSEKKSSYKKYIPKPVTG